MSDELAHYLNDQSRVPRRDRELERKKKAVHDRVSLAAYMADGAMDWYKRTTGEFDYLMVMYWRLDPDGMRTYQERNEEFPPNHDVPDYTYLCTACQQRFWFWSDVLLHVKATELPDG